MSETDTGEVGRITTGEEAGQDYVCRFAIKNVKGLYFVWDKKVKGLDLLEDGAELRITHDGSKYKKVEKIEEAGQKSQETIKQEPKAQDSKIEQAVKKVEAEDAVAWRIARTSATERVFGNGAGPSDIPDEVLIEMFEKADKIAAYIVTGKKPKK